MIRVFAGTGREDVLDGPPEEAAFAQPSGLASDGRFLFVADSEGSAIRRIPLDPSGPVGTVAGTSNLDNGRSLFAFGDADGKGSAARFQHPLGVAYASGRLYVADSYNHKIKVVDPSTGAAETLLGTGKRGDGLNPPEFAEPGGLSVAGGKLYIADTNNQVIKVADTSGRNIPRVLEIEGLAPPRANEQLPDDLLEGNGQSLAADGASGGGRRAAIGVRVSSPRRLQAQQRSSDYVPAASGRADRSSRQASSASVTPPRSRPKARRCFVSIPALQAGPRRARGGAEFHVLSRRRERALQAGKRTLDRADRRRGKRWRVLDPADGGSQNQLS